MIFIKSKLDGHRIPLNAIELVAPCAGCDKEIHVDADLVLHGQMDFKTMDVYCNDCSKKRLEDKK